MADDEAVGLVLVCTSLVFFCALCVHVKKKKKDNTQCGLKTIWENERLLDTTIHC